MKLVKEKKEEFKREYKHVRSCWKKTWNFTFVSVNRV